MDGPSGRRDEHLPGYRGLRAFVNKSRMVAPSERLRTRCILSSDAYRAARLHLRGLKTGWKRIWPGNLEDRVRTMTGQAKNKSVEMISRKEFRRILEKNLRRDRELLERLAKI